MAIGAVGIRGGDTLPLPTRPPARENLIFDTSSVHKCCLNVACSHFLSSQTFFSFDHIYIKMINIYNT
jgi:hypothetical protein